MLITFKSSAAAEITMYKAHIQDVLANFDKNCERGVITWSEAAQFIQHLENLIAKDKQERQLQEQLSQDQEEDDPIEQKNRMETVSLSARFYPLLEMLRLAQKKQKEIVWGI